MNPKALLLIGGAILGVGALAMGKKPEAVDSEAAKAAENAKKAAEAKAAEDAAAAEAAKNKPDPTATAVKALGKKVDSVADQLANIAANNNDT